MKPVCITAFVFLMAVMMSCGGKIYSERTEPCTTSATGDTITLAYRQPSAVFEKCYDNLHASISQVSDSRCPKGVECVWAGTVSVVLQMDGDFNVLLQAGKQVDTTYQQKKFSFTLIDVYPYPVANTPNPSASTKAVIRITKS